jgi:protein-L-isoaspartate(D-aspartate) O-methyltransferase
MEMDRSYDVARERMVAEQLLERNIRDPRVLEAMRTVPRHSFVPSDQRGLAYVDSPLPIGNGQTISQPYIVALMTQLLELKGSEKVLEVGTGSGYQAAVLSQLAAEVYTIERHADLGRYAARILEDLGYLNVHVKIGDGSLRRDPGHSGCSASSPASTRPVGEWRLSGDSGRGQRKSNTGALG